MLGKLLFHYPVFNIGGAEMSMVRMTRLLVEHGWEVELLLTTGGGNLEYRLDPRIKVSYLRDRGAGHLFFTEKRTFCKLFKLGDFCLYLYYRMQELARSIPYLFKKYDVAIISIHSLSPAFCCRWVMAEKRFHWIRNDVSKCDHAGKVESNIRRYHKKIDRYICVSRTAYHSLTTLYPHIKDKAMVLYNVIDANNMRNCVENASNPYTDYRDCLKVVTVCRLNDNDKGLFRMLRIHRRLTDQGLDFYWFVVGDGPDKKRLSEKIQELGLEDRFVLLGSRDNPFPYYKYADISATLSNYEGLCGAINEAKVMGKPIIATLFSGVEEQITNGENGFIVGNDEESIFLGMKRILTDVAFREKLTNDLLPRVIMDDDYKIELLSNTIDQKKS